jgi:hypothetical protein
MISGDHIFFSQLMPATEDLLETLAAPGHLDHQPARIRKALSLVENVTFFDCHAASV